MKKILSMVVILLFLGIAVAPSINSSTIEDDLVELDVEFCGLGRKHTVQLTQQEVDEVEQLFEDIEQRLSSVETRDEAKIIFNEAVVELDRYGLLGGLSIRQAQNFVVNGYSKEQGFSIFEEISHKNSLQELHNNFCCLISGVVQDGYSTGILYMIGIILMLLSVFPSPFPFLSGNPFILLLGEILSIISFTIVNFFPFAFMQQVNILSGNMTSLGLGGIMRFNQGLLNGFNGIKITRINTNQMYLFGFSLLVSYQE
jgi:hypothetical protein